MQPFNFTPFPNLTTDRLVLRQLQSSDDEAIFSLRSDDRVNKYIDRLKQTTIEQAQEFINKINSGIAKNECIYWAITLKDEDRLIGTICYWNFSKENTAAEIGYELHPDFQGKGIMQEALSKVIEFGLQTMKLQTIKAYTHPDNESSTKLLERNNFKRAAGTENTHSTNEVIFTLVNQRNEDDS